MSSHCFGHINFYLLLYNTVPYTAKIVEIRRGDNCFTCQSGQKSHWVMLLFCLPLPPFVSVLLVGGLKGRVHADVLAATVEKHFPLIKLIVSLIECHLPLNIKMAVLS